MKATKGNKVYTIDESQKNSYVKQGFDIIKDGKIIEYGAGKTVPFEDYMKLQAKYEELEKKTAKKKGE